jgi:hypothetical protein
VVERSRKLEGSLLRLIYFYISQSHAKTGKIKVVGNVVWVFSGNRKRSRSDLPCMGLVRARVCNLAAAAPVPMVANYQSEAAYLIGVNYVLSFLRLDIVMYRQAYNFHRRVCVCAERVIFWFYQI